VEQFDLIQNLTTQVFIKEEFNNGHLADSTVIFEFGNSSVDYGL